MNRILTKLFKKLSFNAIVLGRIVSYYIPNHITGAQL